LIIGVVIDVGLIGVVWMLLVVCLLWLFYEVGIWVVTWWYGYDGILDRLLKIKRVIATDDCLPLPIVPNHLSKTHKMIVPLCLTDLWQ